MAGVNLFITRRDVSRFLISLMGFFLGRVVVFQILSPLMLPFLATFLFSSQSFYLTLIFMLLGLLTSYSSLYSLKYFIALGILAGIHFLGQRRSRKSHGRAAFFEQNDEAVLFRSRKSHGRAKFFEQNDETVLFLRAGISAGSVLTAGLFLSFVDGFSPYFIFISIAEFVLTFCLTLVLKSAGEVIGANSRRTYLSNEEMISLAILFGGVMAGAADISVGELSLRYFFSVIFMLVVSFKGGSSLSAMSGVFIGAVLGAAGWHDVSLIPILALAGTAAGILRKKGKVPVCLAFIVAGTISCLYFDSYLLGPSLFFSVLIANICFILMPDKFYFNFNSLTSAEADSTDEYIDKIREVTVGKLNGFSSSFLRLSKIFNSLSEKKNSLTQKDVSKLIDDMAAHVCSHCSMKNFCWDEQFYTTYQYIFAMLGSCERKGKIETADAPVGFRTSCAYAPAFIETTNKFFERYKIDLAWHNRIVESRALVSEQLSSVSKIIEGLAQELDFNMKFNKSMEESIISELRKNRVEVENVIVLENNQGKYEVTFNQRACFGRQSCLKDAIPIMNKVLSRRMRRESEECLVSRKEKGAICKVRLIEEQKFRVTSGVSRAIKTNSLSSGDSYSFMELKNGQCLMALSDGMGSGFKANEESAAAVEMLEEFIESGFEKDVAIKIINSVLVLKSDEDSFSTLDICSVDLYTGAAEFVKIGASSTYLLRGGDVSVIQSTSLPVGILNTVDVEVTHKKLKDSDIIIMMTDGMNDICAAENWIAESLKNFKSNNPQDIADYLLSEAKKLSNDFLRDDMTVLAARIWEKL